MEERGLKFPASRHLFREPPVNITQMWDISPLSPLLILHMTAEACHIILNYALSALSCDTYTTNGTHNTAIGHSSQINSK